jgi:tetratricopeptide (TPR) repeat protein
VAETLNNMAILYETQGKFGDAERLYRRAIAIRERALGANHPDVAMSLSNLATLYQAQDKYVEVGCLALANVPREHPDRSVVSRIFRTLV